MGWAARANRSADKAQAADYQKPRRINLNRKPRLSLATMLHAARMAALLRRYDRKRKAVA